MGAPNFTIHGRPGMRQKAENGVGGGWGGEYISLVLAHIQWVRCQGECGEVDGSYMWFVE